MKFKYEWERRRYERAKATYDEFIKVYPLTLEDLDGEIWKPIPNYEEYFQVSNYGRGKSFSDGAAKILKPILNNHGFLYLNLYKKGKQKQLRVKRLVATLFVDNPDNLPEVNHKLGNEFDNYFENLEWTTLGKVFSLKEQTKGIFNAYAKIKSEEDIVYIRDNPDGLTIKQLAEKFKVSEKTIGTIQLGLRYQNSGGTIRQKRGIPDEDKEKIRADYKKGVKGCGYASLAKKYGYSPPTIARIVND